MWRTTLSLVLVAVVGCGSNKTDGQPWAVAGASNSSAGNENAGNDAQAGDRNDTPTTRDSAE